jgi:hypothetical protein
MMCDAVGHWLVAGRRWPKRPDAQTDTNGSPSTVLLGRSTKPHQPPTTPCLYLVSPRRTPRFAMGFCRALDFSGEATAEATDDASVVEDPAYNALFAMAARAPLDVRVRLLPCKHATGRTTHRSATSCFSSCTAQSSCSDCGNNAN